MPGFLAKEVIVSSMAIIYSSGDAGLVNVIQNQFTPLSAYAFMIFILLYIPCVSQWQQSVKRLIHGNGRHLQLPIL